MSLLEMVNSPASENKQVKPVVTRTSNEQIDGDRRPASDLK